MELVGRLTADAKVNALKDDRKVVNFSIAVNDSYKPKDSEMVKKVVNYFTCSYWVNPNISEHLTKGTLVELYGRIGVNTLTNAEGEAKASLTFHVNNIKLHGRPKSENETPVIEMDESRNKVQQDEGNDVGDDLPF